jgi:deazaflavin-dependent oxidoreductase (nitroreductase family)
VTDRETGRTRMWRLRHLATRFIDPLLLPVATRLPAFGVMTHVGRKMGRVYRTPINLFRRGDDYLFFLTYGPDVRWVKNVFAAGSYSVETGGRVGNSSSRS